MSVSSIIPPQAPRPKPRFIFSENSSVIDTYESFGKEGFADLLTDHADTSANHARFPYEQHKKFLSKVDLEKGPILVSVRTIIRTMAVQADSPKHERREFMYYTTEWSAKDRLGNIIRCSHEAEGRYTQQTKYITTKVNSNGEEEAYYQRGPAREVLTIPWDKKKANELLTSEKVFGEDSLNITNLTEVQYIVKFPNSNPSRTGFDKEDFMNLTYQAMGQGKNYAKSTTRRAKKKTEPLRLVN